MSDQMTYAPCHGYVAQCTCGWHQHHADLSHLHCDGMEHMAEAHRNEDA